MKTAWHQKFKRSSPEARTSRDGTLFHSRAEMLRWEKLQLWMLAGEIRNLRRQVKYSLSGKGIEILTEKGKVMSYTADFVYDRKTPDGWVEVIEDLKGFKGRLEQLRIQVFQGISGKKVTIVR